MRRPGNELGGLQLDSRYTLSELIASGGMGSVYRGVQHSMNRTVAIKVIDTSETRRGDSVRRFLAEAKMASRLNHPNIVPVYDFGQTPSGLLYLVMEHVEGETLSAVLRRGPLPVDRALRLAVQICDALEAAHAHAIVHRDLKPSNIMLVASPSGREFIRLFDFGIARSLVGDDEDASTTAALVGTPQYFAPETATATVADERTDLYALGVVVYEMISGRLPHGDPEDLPTLLGRIVYEEPIPLPARVPVPVQNVVRKLMAKRPADRYPDAATARSALQAALALVPVSASLPALAPEPLPQRTLAVTATAVDVAPIAPRPEALAAGTSRRSRRRRAVVLVVTLSLGLGAALALRTWEVRRRARSLSAGEVQRALDEAAREALDQLETPPGKEPPRR